MHGATREETMTLVRWLRLTLGLTQEQTGRLLGTKAACVSRWESGKTRLSRSKQCHLRLLQRAVAVRGHQLMRREAETLDLSTPEGLIRLVRLGEPAPEAPLEPEAGGDAPLGSIATVNIAVT